MKKIMLLLSVLLISNAMAVNYLTCAVFENETPIPGTKLNIDLDESGSYAETWFIENELRFSLTNDQRGFVKLSLLKASGFESTIVSTTLIEKMGGSEFISVLAFDLENDELDKLNQYHAVCYATGASTRGPWEL